MKAYGGHIPYSWPRHQMEVSGQFHSPAALSVGENSHTGACWLGFRVGTRAGLDAMDRRQFLASAGNRHPAASPVARLYTDWASMMCS
jgi:hypothetical protein